MKNLFWTIKQTYQCLKSSSFVKHLIPFRNTKLDFICCYNSHAGGENRPYNIREICEESILQIIPKFESEKVNLVVREVKEVIAKNRHFPDFIDKNEIEELYKLESRTQRFEYLRFLFRKEKLRISDAVKKANKRKEKQINPVNKPICIEETLNTDYGLGQNSLLFRVGKHFKLKFWNKRLANAVLFGEKIVLDLSYDELMTEKEKKSCASQLCLVYSLNRSNVRPYDMYFCNADSDFRCVQYLKRNIPNIENSLLSLTEKSCTDIFPPNRLVYLSPHASETLEEYDYNAVYIIGAFVDTVKRNHISIEKAKTLGIKSYKLPLDDYIMWGAGSKSLAINQVFEIMLILKNTGSWKKAFEVIPNRKIRRLESNQVLETSPLEKNYLVNTTTNKVL